MSNTATTTTEFLSIAGRWRNAVKALHLDKLSNEDQGLGLAMFYGGFGEGLQACLELAELDEAQAVRLMQCLIDEATRIDATGVVAMAHGSALENGSNRG